MPFDLAARAGVGSDHEDLGDVVAIPGGFAEACELGPDDVPLIGCGLDCQDDVCADHRYGNLGLEDETAKHLAFNLQRIERRRSVGELVEQPLRKVQEN